MNLEHYHLVDILAVYHLVGKTGWSKVEVNGTHRNPEWKFPWDARVPFPWTFPQGQIQAERLGITCGNGEQMKRTFSVWKSILGILGYLSRNPVFFPDIFHFRRPSLSIYIPIEISGFYG